METAIDQPPFDTQRVMDTVLRRVRAEYHEMPGLSLTEGQAERLFGLQHDTCVSLLQELTTTGFLRRTAHGQFVRRNDI